MKKHWKKVLGISAMCGTVLAGASSVRAGDSSETPVYVFANDNGSGSAFGHIRQARASADTKQWLQCVTSYSVGAHVHHTSCSAGNAAGTTISCSVPTTDSAASVALSNIVSGLTTESRVVFYVDADSHCTMIMNTTDSRYVQP